MNTTFEIGKTYARNGNTYTCTKIVPEHQTRLGWVGEKVHFTVRWTTGDGKSHVSPNKAFLTGTKDGVMGAWEIYHGIAWREEVTVNDEVQ